MIIFLYSLLKKFNIISYILSIGIRRGYILIKHVELVERSHSKRAREDEEEPHKHYTFDMWHNKAPSFFLLLPWAFHHLPPFLNNITHKHMDVFRLGQLTYFITPLSSSFFELDVSISLWIYHKSLVERLKTFLNSFLGW